MNGRSSNGGINALSVLRRSSDGDTLGGIRDGGMSCVVPKPQSQYSACLPASHTSCKDVENEDADDDRAENECELACDMPIKLGDLATEHCEMAEAKGYEATILLLPL
uniref:Uncharacterized protein n=1 Tax=Lygus hesperus TaxID=30085 RepID=A0A146M075_LYGHE